MHSRIFQISTMQIEKDNYLNEDTLSQEYLTPFDYCSDIDDDIRMADIANLVNNVLPKGMFELISDDTMRYNGGIEQWKEEYVANIRKNAEAITVDNMLTHRGTHNLRKAIDNPSVLFGWKRMSVFCRAVHCVYGFCLRTYTGSDTLHRRSYRLSYLNKYQSATCLKKWVTSFSLSLCVPVPFIDGYDEYP